MRIALIADAYPPMRTSAAVQLRDLSQEMVRQGHSVTVMIPDAHVPGFWSKEEVNGVCVLRLKAPRTKDVGLVRRTFNECVMPFAMLRNLRRSPMAHARWDGVVWYAPSIFLAPVASALKSANGCRSYLIVRDIFPQWALDMGLMGRNLPYFFFKAVERYQYSVADVIGVQSPGNLRYFDSWADGSTRRVEVLQNWLAESPNTGCSISVADGPLAGRIVFVYAGNMGVAQGVGIFLDLAERLRDRDDIGFLFVGRGSDSESLRQRAEGCGLTNVVFHEEIDSQEITGLYAQCHVGLVALDQRHQTHNIPGKFLSYMQGGLPVLASINAGNDLAAMVDSAGVGCVCVDGSPESLRRMAISLVSQVAEDPAIRVRCRALSQRLFSPQFAVEQILSALRC